MKLSIHLWWGQNCKPVKAGPKKLDIALALLITVVDILAMYNTQLADFDVSQSNGTIISMQNKACIYQLCQLWDIRGCSGLMHSMYPLSCSNFSQQDNMRPSIDHIVLFGDDMMTFTSEFNFEPVCKSLVSNCEILFDFETFAHDADANLFTICQLSFENLVLKISRPISLIISVTKGIH